MVVNPHVLNNINRTRSYGIKIVCEYGEIIRTVGAMCVCMDSTWMETKEFFACSMNIVRCS